MGWGGVGGSPHEARELIPPTGGHRNQSYAESYSESKSGVISERGGGLRY